MPEVLFETQLTAATPLSIRDREGFESKDPSVVDGAPPAGTTAIRERHGGGRRCGQRLGGYAVGAGDAVRRAAHARDAVRVGDRERA